MQMKLLLALAMLPLFASSAGAGTDLAPESADRAKWIATAKAICEPDGVFLETSDFDAGGNAGSLDCRGLYAKLGIPIPAIEAHSSGGGTQGEPAFEDSCDVPPKTNMDPLTAAIGSLGTDVAKADETAKEAECKKTALENAPHMASDFACAAARESIQIGTLGASAILTPIAESMGFKSKCIGSSKGTCLGSALSGVIKNLVWNITGLWDLIKLPYTLVKWAFFSDTAKVEDMTSDKMHDASGASDKEVKSFDSDPWGWLTSKMGQFWDWISKQITDNFGCQEWEGSAVFGSIADSVAGERMEGHKRCIKPWVCFAAATPSQMINSVCGVIGAIGAEGLTAFLTGGAVELTGWSLKAAHASLEGIEGFKAYKTATTAVKGAVEGIKTGTKATVHGATKTLHGVDAVARKIPLGRFAIKMAVGTVTYPLDIALALTRVPGIKQYLRWNGKMFYKGQYTVALKLQNVEFAGKVIQSAGRVKFLEEGIQSMTAAGSRGRAAAVDESAKTNAALLAERPVDPAVASEIVNLGILEDTTFPVMLTARANHSELAKALKSYQDAKLAYAEALADSKELFLGRWVARQDAANLQKTYFQSLEKFNDLAGARGVIQLIDEKIGDAVLKRTLKEIEEGVAGAMLRTGTKSVDRRLARWADEYEKAFKRMNKFSPGDLSKAAVEARESVAAYHEMIDTTIGRAGAFSHVLGAREMRELENWTRKKFPEKIPGSGPARTLASKITDQFVEKAESVLKRRGINYTVKETSNGKVIVLTELDANQQLIAREWDPAAQFRSCPGAL